MADEPSFAAPDPRDGERPQARSAARPADNPRLERLMEAWRVLSALRDGFRDALRPREIAALGTAMAIVDACVSIEEGLFARRDDYGNVTADPDKAVLARLREIAAARDIFAAERPKQSEETAEHSADQQRDGDKQ